MAKLVEILAQKLKEWPNNWEVVGQACDGSLHGEPFDNRHTDERYTICYRYIIDEVTRAEWQAAVDALKAKDTASSTAAMIDAGWIDPKPPVSPSLHAQVVDRANRIPEWDGVGLPPAGTTCERRFPDVRESSWNVCIILAHGARKIFVRDNCGDEWAHHLDEVEFRPFRTPEQIAAEEREKAIAEMVATAKMATGFGQNVADHAALYDAGYRKQEPK